MASETAALYERILSLVPKDELAGSYNDVLREEISSVNRAVNDVSAAFTKLEEVRDAVTKLSDGATGSRSESLVREMDNAMELQRNLNRRIKSVLAAESWTDGLPKNKRKKTDELHRSSHHEAVDAATKDEDGTIQSSVPTVYVVLRLDDRGTKSSVDTFSASKMSKHNYLDLLLELAQVSVLEWSRQLPAVLPVLAKLMPDISPTNAIPVMKYVVLWAYLSSGHEGALKALRTFHDAMLPLVNRVQGSEARSLRRLSEEVSKVVECQAVQLNDETQDHSCVRLDYDSYIWHVNAMATAKRRKHAPQALSALGKAMAQAILSHKQPIKIITQLRVVVQWAQYDPRDSELFESYDRLVADSKAYADKVSDFMLRVRLLREARKIENAIGELPKTPVYERATNALVWARQLRRKVMSIEDLDKGILMLDEVIRHQEPGWKPRKSKVALECSDILKAYAELFEEGETRRQRWLVMLKWGFGNHTKPRSNVYLSK